MWNTVRECTQARGADVRCGNANENTLDARARWEGTRRGTQCGRGEKGMKTNENARQVRQGTQTQCEREAERPSTHGYSQEAQNEREMLVFEASLSRTRQQVSTTSTRREPE